MKPPTIVEVVAWVQSLWAGLYSVHCMVEVSYYSSLGMMVGSMTVAVMAIRVRIAVLQRLAARSHRRALYRMTAAAAGPSEGKGNKHHSRPLLLKQLLVTMLLLFKFPSLASSCKPRPVLPLAAGAGSRLT